MTNNFCEYGKGTKLVNAIKTREIKEERRPNHGKKFSGGYERVYYDKFCSYLGNVSRYMLNLELEEKNYNG